MNSETKSIDALTYTNHFVSELPADEETRVYPRTVEKALFSRTTPTPVRAPKLLCVVPEVAHLLELSTEPTQLLAEVLGGNRVLDSMKPYAQCYGGHQFGSWARQLGDGRAITLAEVQTSTGASWELQLKGAGPTAYSRRGDGRAVLRSSIRELVCSEAMVHLGIASTRALALVQTGEPVLRDMFYDGHPQNEPGAIVTRVAPSFLRFGSFELPASRGDTVTLKRLFDFTIDRYFPDISKDDPNAVAQFFATVCERTIALVVQWMRVGFVHGVMNTDNMSILGLSIDYGPYGWIEPFDPEWTPNTTDGEMRRYCFGNQPRIAIWNLAQLANALAPLCTDLRALKEVILSLTKRFDAQLQEMALLKLGLLPQDSAEGRKADSQLVQEMSNTLMSTETDMTLFFRALAKISTSTIYNTETIEQHFAECFYQPEKRSHADRELFANWIQSYLERTRKDARPELERTQAMNTQNPLYVPRNYLLQQVIERVTKGETQAIDELLEVLRNPYSEQPGKEKFAQKRPEWARSKAGCSMLSCSS